MAGDSLAVIEVRFGLQQIYLELANPQVDFNHLTVGQVLNIPLTGSLTPPTASPGST
jgi:LysM repeat protein